MFRPAPLTPFRPAPPGRRGTILIVVLALLALLAVIAISFVFYADGESTAARYYRDAQTRSGNSAEDAPDPEPTINATLAALIFDDTDSGSGLLNALRGHSLMATMYGRQTGGVPFNGVGTFSDPAVDSLSTAQNLTPPLTRPKWVNYNAPLVSGMTSSFVAPEYAGVQTSAGPGSGTYLPKNAPYTYPDANNLFLASLSPATGDVLVPSFHRNWIFGTFDPPGSATPNPNWTNAQGRVMTLRPRPQDQMYNGTTEFPYIPANADGSYTGDVQNLFGGVGVQKNDSILLDIGLPVRNWNGKKIKPLVAVLVTDLDGLLNLNAHGNVRNGGNHASYAGYGPWEVNLAAVLSTPAGPMGMPAAVNEANGVVSAKYGTTSPQPKSAGGVSTLAYDRSGARLPQHALVNWDATGTPAGSPAVQLPSFTAMNPFQTSPSFPNTTPTQEFFDDNIRDTYPPPPTTPNQEFDKNANHPGLYNPSDWAALTGATPDLTKPFAYPLADLRRMRQQYAGGLDDYKKTMLSKITTPPNSTAVGTSAAGAGYRLDPAHAKRLLLTALSAGRDLPGLMPNYGGTSGTLQLTSPAYHASRAAPAAFTNPPVPGNDYAASGTDARNARAALGPIDLNRPLTGYWVANTAPTSGAVLTPTQTQAWADRHNLARDIFARLVVATGAQATVDLATGNVSIPATVTAGSPEYNALRYLAQLSANAVDVIDSDDISTLFVWNPTPGPLAVLDAAGVVAQATANTLAPADVQNRVVFGVEKPRLVINEAYGEIVNDPADDLTKAPAKAAHVRFWVELLNPTKTPYAAGTGPLGDGSVKFLDGAVNPYKLSIVRAGKTAGGGVPAFLQQPQNVTGEIDDPAGTAPATPDIDFQFNSKDVTLNPAKQVLAPNNGDYKTTGFAVVGPKFDTAMARASEFKPDTANAPWNGNGSLLGDDVTTDAATAMSYVLDPASMKPPKATDLEGETVPGGNLRRHVVLLRRLANPYLPVGPTNPYVTVDYMDYVPATDAVLRGDGDVNDRTAKGAAGAAGYDPKTGAAARAAGVGKVQPYAGHAAAVGMPPLPPTVLNTVPNSFVVAQNPAAAPDGQPLHTFFRHNGREDDGTKYTAQTTTTTASTMMMSAPRPGSGRLPSLLTVAPVAATAVDAAAPVTGLAGGETLMAPFDWFVHFDRPLVNQLELLQVHAVKPHEVTQTFLQPPADPTATPRQPVRRGMGYAPWLGVTAPAAPGVPAPYFDPTSGLPAADPASGNLTRNGLYRAFELLRVKPWGYGAGLGGRVHGRVNVNTIQDKQVLAALLDPTGGNAFTTADVDTLWAGWISNRTPGRPATAPTLANGTAVDVPLAGKTLDDDPTAPTADRPFKSFGVGEFTTGPAVAASGLQDTLLRVDPATGKPRLWVGSQTHPYLQAEMARKLLNNATTVSNVFAVYITVVYHEVRTDASGNPALETIAGTPGRPILGKEAYRETPGDMRQQFFAVVDRSNLLVPTPGATTVVQQPVFAALDQAAGPGTTNPGTLVLANATASGSSVVLYSDGQPVSISAGTQLVIGVGANQETVSVTAVSGTSLTAAVVKAHAAGELVSNGVAGNPGPQPALNVVSDQNSQWKGVIPLVTPTR